MENDERQKVFVVFYRDPYDEHPFDQFEGVFATRSDAEARINSSIYYDSKDFRISEEFVN